VPRRILACNPCISDLGRHDPSAAIFIDGELTFAAEEERYSRDKQSFETFPTEAIKHSLDHCGLTLEEIDKIVIPWDPNLHKKAFKYDLRLISQSTTTEEVFTTLQNIVKRNILDTFGYSRRAVEKMFQTAINSEGTLPPISFIPHHKAHAASAYYFSPFRDALVVTIDAEGEYDSTVVWIGQNGSLTRHKTYTAPNSLGYFYAVITDFLGYQGLKDEGKVMGLAPYGSSNNEIRRTLQKLVNPGIEYDATGFTISTLEAAFDRKRKESPSEFTQWEKDLAFEAQRLLEETVSSIVDQYVQETGLKNVCLAGGVALNCKMNGQIRKMSSVDKLFVQPVAHDGGSALGAGALSFSPEQISELNTLYLGDQYSQEFVRKRLEEYKLNYNKPSHLTTTVAELLADGQIIGWFQGRCELGPRALGHRSIFADPRSETVRVRVNEQVKHREQWRPFAPVILESCISSYLDNPIKAPYMIQTFDTNQDYNSEIIAGIHPADGTTRPQTITPYQNSNVAELLHQFEELTGVPALLNTSFNDHGEPIVRTPTEAISMYTTSGLDALVLGDFLVKK